MNRKILLIETNDLGGYPAQAKIYEQIDVSEKELAHMIRNKRIDPKEKLFQAVLVRVNKRTLLKS